MTTISCMSQFAEVSYHTLPKTSADILIIPGDVAPLKQGLHRQFFSMLCDQYKHVVFVPGDVEFWDSHPEWALEELYKIQDGLESIGYSNLHVLFNRKLELEGLLIGGAPLFYPACEQLFLPQFKENRQRHYSDFSKIIEWGSKYYDAWYRHALKLFMGNTLDVWVTHHAPARILLRGFQGENSLVDVGPLNGILETKQPQLGIYGTGPANFTYCYQTPFWCRPQTAPPDFKSLHEVKTSLLTEEDMALHCEIKQQVYERQH